MIVLRTESIAAVMVIAVSLPVFGVGLQPDTATLVDLILVGRLVTTSARKLSLSIFRVFRISFSVPNGFAGSHLLFPSLLHQ
jgi:hypothetical protein